MNSARPKTTLILLLVIGSLASLPAQDLYWIDGSGDWNDPNHWSEAPPAQNAGPAGRIPTAEDDVEIGPDSGLKEGSVITLPAGNVFAVQNLDITTTVAFGLDFAGVNGSNVVVEIYGSLFLSPEMQITYAEGGAFANRWALVDAVEHKISTAGKDLNSLELRSEGATYIQLDDLLATSRIRMFGGNWKTENFDVRTDLLLFRDANGSANPLTKVLAAGTSDIYAGEFNARFVYNSLTVTGAYTIHSGIFQGSPGNEFQNATFNEVRLQPLADDPPGGGSIIEYNNFECAYCTINRLIIEDDGAVVLANAFTVAELLEVTLPETTVKFNGGNGRINELTINGSIVTPPAGACGPSVRFETVFSDEATFRRASGTVTVNDAVLDNIVAVGEADFFANRSILRGNTVGWTVAEPAPSRDLVWVGPAPGGVGDWDVPENWRTADGSSTRCVPGITDRVVINRNSVATLRIPPAYTAECSSLVWEDAPRIELELAGQGQTKGQLVIRSDLRLNGNAKISTEGDNRISFEGLPTSRITTAGVLLPGLVFTNGSGRYELEDELKCDRITVEGGTFDTRDQDVTTANWHTEDSQPKTYIFGSSMIRVSERLVLTKPGSLDVTIDPGSSLIETPAIEALGFTLNDLRLTNATQLIFNSSFDYTLTRLLLAGSGAVYFPSGLTADEVASESDGQALDIGAGETLTVNRGIRSETSPSDPGRLRSHSVGEEVTLEQPNGNLCISGPVALRDVDADLGAVTHAPEGIDVGNNSGINFAAGNTATLYWRSGSGVWNRSDNWSRVSGGCPSVVDPPNANRLIFDDNARFAATDTITVTGPEIADTVEFRNGDPVVVQVVDELQASSLKLSGGYVTWNGNSIAVSRTTSLASGIIINAATDFRTEGFTGASGLAINRPGGTLTIGEDGLFNQGAMIVNEPGGWLILDESDAPHRNLGELINNGEMIVTDDLINSGDLTSDQTNSTLTFDGSLPATFTPGGATIRSLALTKVDADLSLGGDLELTGELILGGEQTGGQSRLVLGEHTLTLGGAATVFGQAESRYVRTNGSGTLTRRIDRARNLVFPVGNTGQMTPLSAEVSGSAYTEAVVRVRTIPSAVSGIAEESSDYVNRHWIVKAEGIADYRNAVTATYLEGEVTGQQDVIAGASRTTDGRWDRTDGGRSGRTLTATVTEQETVFSGLGSMPLPVDWIGFSAREVEPGTVRLDWATAGEQNSSHFTPERSTDAVNWTDRSEVAAAGIATGRSDYSFRDNDLPVGSGLLYYRLRQVDLDGATTHSPTRTVLVSDVTSLGVYPNPAAQVLRLRGSTDIASVSIFGMDGKRWLISTATEVDISSLPAGPYRAVVVVAGERRALPFTKGR